MRIMTEDPELASTRWQDVNAGFYLVWFDKIISNKSQGCWSRGA
jgi:hypothetical protein